MSVLYFKDKETGLFVAVKSIAGEKGEDGKKGENGGYYTPSVVDGALSWTPSDENMPAVDATNIVSDVLKALPTWEGGEF